MKVRENTNHKSISLPFYKEVTNSYNHCQKQPTMKNQRLCEISYMFTEKIIGVSSRHPTYVALSYVLWYSTYLLLLHNSSLCSSFFLKKISKILIVRKMVYCNEKSLFSPKRNYIVCLVCRGNFTFFSPAEGAAKMEHSIAAQNSITDACPQSIVSACPQRMSLWEDYVLQSEVRRRENVRQQALVLASFEFWVYPLKHSSLSNCRGWQGGH